MQPLLTTGLRVLDLGFRVSAREHPQVKKRNPETFCPHRAGSGAVVTLACGTANVPYIIIEPPQISVRALFGKIKKINVSGFGT